MPRIDRKMPTPAIAIGTAAACNCGIRTPADVVAEQGRSRRDTQGRGRENRPGVRFVQVSAHARDVADVVADVVCDGGRVAGVVFRNARFDLADEVRADVRGFREDTAADAGEEGLGTCSHPEAEHRNGDVDQRQGFIAEYIGPDVIQESKPQCDVNQPQADDGQAHDGPRTEGDLQTLIQRLLSARCGSAARPRGGPHAKPSSQAREKATRQKCERHEFALHLQDKGGDREQNDDHKKERANNFVLLFQIRVRTFANIARDLDHACVAFIGGHHRFVKQKGLDERHYRSGKCKHPDNQCGIH